MKLLVVSHTAHYLDEKNRVLGWAPTVREIDRLASRFESVRHVAWLHSDSPPQSATRYRSTNVRLVPVRPSGGPSVLDKVAVVWRCFGYALALHRELGKADVVHVRCPANISLVALLLLLLRRRPRYRWVKYAGDWRPVAPTPWSYSLQRCLLRWNVHRGLCTVNGRWPDQPKRVFSFLNPCFDLETLSKAAIGAHLKEIGATVRIIFVGALVAEKGVEDALRVVAEVRRRGVEAALDLVGDGPQRERWRRRAVELGVADHCRFRGWLTRSDLDAIYAESHLLLCTSFSEGLPKILGEGMAHGVVPVASAISCIPQVLQEAGTGTCRAPGDVAGFASSISFYAANPRRWAVERSAGLEAAKGFTYEAYLDRLRDAFLDTWRFDIGEEGPSAESDDTVASSR